MKIIYSLLGKESFLEIPNPDKEFLKENKEQYEDMIEI